MECPVCYELYNLTDREPKVLQCNHTLCDRCLHNVRKGDNVQCPTCRGESGIREVKTNFGLTEAIASKCQSCLEQTRAKKCCHCQQELCEVCLNEHSVIYRDEAKLKVDNLRRRIVDATALAMDETEIDQEATKKESTISDIKQVIQIRKDELDRVGEDLAHEVEQVSDQNVRAQAEWSTSLDSQLDTCKKFVRSAKDKVGKSHAKDTKLEEIAVLQKESDSLLNQLDLLQENPPEMTTYSFESSGSQAVNIGRIACQPIASDDIAKDSPILEDNPEACHQEQIGGCKAVAGGHGSGPEEFLWSASIAIVGDRVFVTDKQNHRLKLYDLNLDLKCVVGEKGPGRDQFNEPWGLCWSGNELFICDRLNDRIKVYNKYLQVLRVFGEVGSGGHGFNSPLGIAAGPRDIILVCDAGNNRIKLVKRDGTFIRSITHKDVGYPHAISVTPEGTILVMYTQASNVHMFNFNGKHHGSLIKALPDAPNKVELQDLALDNNSNIIVTDSGNDRLIVLNSHGNVIRTIGRSATEKEELSGPRTVAVSATGDIFVYELGIYRLRVLEVSY